MNSNERRKKVKKKLQELGLSKNRKFIKLTCTICGKENELRINNPDIYTEEVRKRYKCWKCKKE